jgi:hypothetical protein
VGGSAWLENLRRRNEKAVKVEAIRPVDDARVPALREVARLRVGGRQRLYGTMMHRMLSRLDQGQEVEAAKMHEAAYLLRADLRLRPMCSAANAVNMLRRKGLIDADSRVTDAGRAWLVEQEQEIKADSRAKQQRQARLARLRFDLPALIAEMIAGVPIAAIAPRYGMSKTTMRRALKDLDPVGYRASVEARVVQGRQRGHVEAAKRRAARETAGARRSGTRRREDADYGAGLAVLDGGAGLKLAARAAGLSVSAMRGRLRTDGLWPRAGGNE